MGISIRRATARDVGELAPLFDAYRCFYERESDTDLAREFLRERLRSGESTVFVAEDSDRPVGFVQLFPSFDSVEAGAVWILHDLFVDPGCRGSGIGRALMDAAGGLARESGAVGLSLATAHDNDVAQALYESLGYRRDERFYHYFLRVGGSTSEGD